MLSLLFVCLFLGFICRFVCWGFLLFVLWGFLFLFLFFISLLLFFVVVVFVCFGVDYFRRYDFRIYIFVCSI